MSITDSEKTAPVAESTDEFIARVLDQEHRAAYAHAAPEEARVILRLAQAFADELEKLDLRFDRLRFIETTMEERA
jgi:flavin reductase (DIM6/NTAB) family NADH-FMN oxidoreductase RutF